MYNFKIGPKTFTCYTFKIGGEFFHCEASKAHTLQCLKTEGIGPHEAVYMAEIRFKKAVQLRQKRQAQKDRDAENAPFLYFS